jgi:hypothetical protein
LVIKIPFDIRKEINVYKVYTVWWESPKERDHLEDQGVDGIRMDHREIDWWGGLDSTGSEYGPVVSCCECGDVPRS